MKKLSVVILTLLAPLLLFAADDAPKAVPPGTPVTITVTQAAAPSPNVTITLGARQAQAVPCKGCLAHSGGGNIDVQSPSPDTVIITFTGAAVACLCNAGFDYTLDQCLCVVFEKPDIKLAKVTLEGRVIGLLRGKCKKGCATVGEGHASLMCGPVALVSVATPAHSVCGCQALSINDHDGPACAPIGPGKYDLHVSWHLNASSCIGKSSSEFAPDPAIDPIWISYKEPFHGAAKKDFGLQIVLKVAEDTSVTNGTNGDKKEEKKEDKKEKLPAPKPDPEKNVSRGY